MKELISYLKSNQYIRTAKIIKDIIPNPYFQRLKDISYLATFKFAFHKDIEFSRYRHSIETALILAKLVVRNNIKEYIGSKVILYGLLHDIGHIFFSHIGERILERRENFSHEKYGKFIIENHFDSIFKKYDFEVPLFEKIPNEHRVLIKSHFDMDTIQGIYQTAQLLNLNSIKLDEIINNFYFSIKSNSWKINKIAFNILIDFWKLKSKIYRDYVYALKNQFVEYLMIKYIRRISILSKDLTESELKSIFLKSRAFRMEYSKLNYTNQLNSFFIDLNKPLLKPKMKDRLLKIMEKLNITDFRIIKVKVFENPDFNGKQFEYIENLVRKIKDYYENIYRIYVFCQKNLNNKVKIMEEIKSL